MSYQPFPVQVAAAPAPSNGTARRRMLGLALATVIAGLIAAIALSIASSNQYKDAVSRLQRAPVGCDTQYEFTGTGVFLIYLESAGRIGSTDGDCPGLNETYARGDGGRPRVSLSLVDDSGRKVELERTIEASYSADGFVGQSYREVTIKNPGTYTLSVESSDTDFAVAIGRNPKADTKGLKRVGILIGIGALLLGALLALLGLRKGAAQQAAPVMINNYGFTPQPPSAPPYYQPLPTPAWTPPPPPPPPLSTPAPAVNWGPPAAGNNPRPTQTDWRAPD